jgi:sugar lactone lactonase YvrE
LALDRTGCLLIADRGNNRIRKIQKNGIITTIAGGGTDAWAENVLATTVSVTAGGLLVDSLNNIFIADVGRGRVRVISSSGYIVTIAGTGTMGYSGDGGPATAAKLGSPDFLLFDNEGNLLLADNENDRIRKIDKLGIITTFAGNGTSAFAGDGGPATAASLKTNCGMQLDSWGNILFADAGNRRIRSISSAGTIQTIAGGGTAAPYFGDGGPALGCGLNYPTDIALTKDGSILVADRNNHRIRKISSNVGVKDMVLNAQLVVFPNPCTTYFEIIGAEAFAGATLGLFDLDGRQVLEQIWQKGDKVTLPEHLPEGLYVVSLVLPGKSIVGVIEKGEVR